MERPRLLYAFVAAFGGLTWLPNPAGAQVTSVAPLTLRQVLDSVTRSHPMLEAARARVRAAKGARVTAGTFGNPVLSYQVENTAFPGQPALSLDRETRMTATLPAESFYQRWPRARRAGADLRAAEADSAAERQRVSLDAAEAFYRTALAQVAAAAARDVTTWLDSVVVYNTARAHEGLAAEADLIRAEVERDRATADAALDEADLARARADLATFLGAAPVPPATLVVALDDAPLALAAAVPNPQDALPSALTVRALEVRPDVRAAQERVAGAKAGVESEWTMIVRQLGATVGAKRSAGTTSFMFGLTLPFPLFDQNRGEIARAAAERDAATFELAGRERAVRAEVWGAYNAAQLLTERAEALARGPRTYLALADESRRIALGAYREGAVPLMQLIDALRAWSDARTTFYRTLFAQHQSVLALLTAQGLEISVALRSDSTVGATTSSEDLR
jgi:cobalt-zinc-cadmium efflux system outer membrane protein